MKTMRLQYLLYLVFFMALFITSCKKRPPGPHLKNLAPERGSVGTRIAIEGENLFYFEKAFVNDAEVTEEPIVTSNGERMELIVPDNVAAGLTDVYLLYEDGRSNSLQFEVTDGISGNGSPVINNLIPSTVLTGCELHIEGENLDKVTSVIFPVDLPAAIVSQSASQLIVEVPDDVIITGDMFLHTPTDTVSRTIVTDMGAVPVINRILPAANDQGGPVLVYGKNLNLVNQVFFGEVEQPLFSKTSNTLKLHVPKSEVIKGKKVSFQLKTIQGCFSTAVDYEVGNGISAQSPVNNNSINIVIPSTPGGVSLPGINNNWKLVKKFWTDDPQLDFLPLLNGSPDGATDTLSIIDNGDTLAVYTENGTFLQVTYGGQLYFGALDDTYPDYDPDVNIITPIRFVLTPLDFGDQIELIKPYVIDVGASKKEGNTFTIKGRYFQGSANNDIKVKIYAANNLSEVSLLMNNSVTFIDKTTIEFILLDSLLPGAYLLVLRDLMEYDATKFSNAFPFEIN